MARSRSVLRVVRSADPEFAAALARRWTEPPAAGRTPGQVLGRHAVGCEGTHGVFPHATWPAPPCYHSRDANQVRVDGPHTLAQCWPGSEAHRSLAVAAVARAAQRP